LKELTLQDCIKISQEIFIENSRPLEIHLIGQNHIEENQELREQREKSQKNALYFENSQLMKKTLGLYPDYYSLLHSELQEN
jgi:hypothetical protein